ncbi:MAG: CvpA family protein [Saprospiraceae bacterium]|uniref:CvpA family protein n=1 Tax=Candidatus Brachybacter algidus TaxID=2982024 RepID=UPI001B4C124E|nr:CvpA family protein [Candidatus Brachybacter algidus]MBP7304500.1 CvpA family protein [Saprospiraceae bacterium]MBK6372421.1 CvpA family protein [Candidatus Brachybacter algidus]MBK6450248.1 CvpA family protein [Candidatus Brachybacter algidus]MBK7603171.1 CvpA family protein [Candidatus Brachybacter algidus]MBK8356569.1 CvpA family protein [Candidatus Brachybacter algidus]
MIIDILLIILLTLGFYAGYSNGVFGVALKILLFLGSILLALKLFPIVFLFMENTFTDITLVYFVFGFILVLGIVFFLYRFLSRKIESWVSSHSMKLATKISGGLILSLFVLLLCSFVSGRLVGLKVLKRDNLDQSLIYPLVESIDKGAGTLMRNTKATIDKTFEQNVKTINQIDSRQKVDSAMKKSDDRR